MFNFFQSRPVLQYNMRTFSFVDSENKVYLYDFDGKKVNGYFIRQEVAHDLLLRGMEFTARKCIRGGQLFIDKKGAGIVLDQEWLSSHDNDDSLMSELAAAAADLGAREYRHNMISDYAKGIGS